MYDCIIFDIDGTILDTKEASLLSVQQAYFMESGKLLPFEEIDFAFGVTTKKTAQRLNVADADTFVSNIDRQYHLHSDKNRIFPGVEDAIRNLYEKGVYLGVVTSKAIWEYEHDFSHFGLTEYFGTAICVEDTKKHKPDPEPLFEFFSRSGQKKETALFIGDSANDQLCAKNASVDFALAGWGAAENLPAKYILDDPSQILKIV
jgi:HAD superfamily hydrolase (TIGR01549 family)